MPVAPDAKPPSRRHSFSSFAAEPHRHCSIPSCATSHPDNPIPSEPSPAMDSPVLEWKSKTRYSPQSSPRSSAESLSVMSDDTSDSETPPSTPPNEAAELTDEKNDSVSGLPPRESSPPRRKRRASTTYAANSEEIKRLLGDGRGTKFLEKYCCGEGCCRAQKLAAPQAEPLIAIRQPDNDAYRFLQLNTTGLAIDTELTKIVDLPEAKFTFAPLRRQSIQEKFPEEAGHDHTEDYVNTYAPEYMKPHPPYSIFSAPVHDARELTKPGAEKRTFHFDLDVTEYPAEGGVDFKVGGAIGICPPNDAAVVEDIFNQLGIPRFQRDKPIRLLTKGGRWPTIWGDEAERELVTTRREVLTWTVDISSSAPTKPLFRVLAEYASAPNEKQILMYLSSAQGQAAFCDLRTGPHVTIQQLLHAFPSSKPPLESICSLLSQLMPRFYSLSNDPHVSSAREGLAGRRLVEMAVTVHETSNYDGKLRAGVGSGFLERVASKFVRAERGAQKEAVADGEPLPLPGVAGRRLGLQVPMFRGLMANPLSKEFASDGPMLLIGAGVGMAPFRGFILNRLKNANCANKIWLIQGIRDSMLDEIYQGELGAHESEIKKVVQSRVSGPPPVSADQPAVSSSADDDAPARLDPDTAPAKSQNHVAKYVQDEVRLQADVVWFVINAPDGRIFVCGSTKGMGEGVESALVDVAMDKGGLDATTARQFWSKKAEVGQYIRETW